MRNGGRTYRKYIQEELSELQSYFGSIEELCEHEDDIICHSGCDDMADVARYYLEGVYFVTQNTDDLLDEKLKNNLGLKFAFRSTDINEIKKTLAFFGVDSEDENNQKRLRDLENGQCLISDLYGRVGVIQFHPDL